MSPTVPMRVLAIPALVLAGLAACAPPQPTPYHPLEPEARRLGGYEETRLQDDVYRVSFRGNRYTPEEDVVDMLYLRCAEVTLAAGYTHFEVTESFGSFEYRFTPRHRGGETMIIRPRNAEGFMVFVGPGVGAPDYVARPDTRVAMFVIRLRKSGGAPGGGEGAEDSPTRYDAKALTESLAGKKHAPTSGGA